MTITYVGAGTVATGNNTSVTPGLPSGRVTGDLLLVAASIRNSGTGVPNTPANWTPLLVFGNVGIYGRFNATGVTAPTITFTGGVANADTQAAMLAFRGVSPDALVNVFSGSQLNGSAQNIAYPAFDVPGAAHALLLLLWKQDDSTAVGALSGFTAAFNSSVTTGDDATLQAQYVIQTTETDITSGSSTITGGAAAISRALWLAFKPAAALTLQAQDAYPPRVQVSVTGLTIGDAVQIYRVVDGTRTLIRGGSNLGVTDPSMLVVDAELPFGKPVSYVAVVEGLAEYATSATTYDLPGGKVAVSDAVTGESAEVVILAAGDKSYTRDSARFRVAGRNIVVTGPQGQAEGSYDLFVDSTASRDNLLSLLTNATEAVIQIRQPGVSAVTGDPYDGIDAYLAVDHTAEKRFSQDGSDPRRVFTIDYAEVDGWSDALLARGFTLQDVHNYINGTLQNLADFNGAGGTLLDIALADWSP